MDSTSLIGELENYMAKCLSIGKGNDLGSLTYRTYSIGSGESQLK